MEPPSANKARLAAQTKENRFSLPVMAKMFCASIISLRKIPGLFRLVASLISSFSVFGFRSRNENSSSVNSTGFSFSKRKKPVIIPKQASN
jgi:hypothetical protein